MPDEIPTLRGLCLCLERTVAMQEGRFLYRFDAPEGWCFADDPPRSTTFEKAYFSGSNHTGEPFIWDPCCPWCGKEMLTPPLPYGQGDGWKGEDGG